MKLLPPNCSIAALACSWRQDHLPPDPVPQYLRCKFSHSKALATIRVGKPSDGEAGDLNAFVDQNSIRWRLKV
eukprot:751470-Hanusia_phi.AAC.3